MKNNYRIITIGCVSLCILYTVTSFIMDTLPNTIAHRVSRSYEANSDSARKYYKEVINCSLSTDSLHIQEYRKEIEQLSAKGDSFYNLASHDYYLLKGRWK